MWRCRTRPGVDWEDPAAGGCGCGCGRRSREYFPAALAAFDDLTAPDALDLLGAAPDPQRAARLSRSRIVGALKRARRRDVEAKTERIQTLLRAEQLTQPPELVAAYAATVSAAVAVIIALNTQIIALQG